MRIATVVALLLLTATSVMAANIGSITVHISSPDDNGPLDLDPAVGRIQYGNNPGSVPIVLEFTATSDGPDGDNNGVQSISLQLDGSALAGATQSALTPDPTFVALASLGGLGFDELGSAGGVGATGMIGAIGDIQALPGAWNAGDDAADVGHVGSVMLATGSVELGPSLAALTDYEIRVSPDGPSFLWDIGFGDTQGADGAMTAELVVRFDSAVSASAVSWSDLKARF